MNTTAAICSRCNSNPCDCKRRVRLGHVPNWFRLRLLKAFGTRGGYTAGWAVIDRVVDATHSHGRWLDHWGSTVIDGQVCFVSEPYENFPPSESTILGPKEIAERTGCELIILPDSEWNPPATIRLMFKPNEATAPK